MKRAIFPPLVTQAQIDAEIRRREAWQRVGDFVSGVAAVVICVGVVLMLIGMGVGR